ncbi:hypothetical protein [Gottfriedia acidiceleris]|uniref:Uncharacterized protein n=1 Tax=Gottfriedia acidiceleris TaxID=371036 RepID=A0ABY4JNE0_9BACI|nr:hypothetical protein [Gottfriedia acidiceleris]UPM55366.1 hypothetical protein MY490_05855 [Gottfriedia acidiceleris]
MQKIFNVVNIKAKLLIILISTIMSFSVCIPKSNAVIALEGNGTHSSISGATLWANPVTAKKIGYTIKTTKKITRTELLQISNYIDNQESGRSIQLAIATSIVVLPLKPLIGVGAGLGVGLLTTYKNTQGKIVSSTLKNSTKSFYNVTLIYQYRQVGPSDGYYFISKITII